MGKHKTPYDAEKHCGAAANLRNPERLAKAIERSTVAMKRLECKLNVPDREAKMAYHERVLKNAQTQLEKLAKDPDDRPCVNKKGLGTDHEGDGYCVYHCKCHGRRGWHSVNGHVYQHIRHRRINEALALVEQQTMDIMDLVPEVKMLKALFVVFFEESQRKKTISPKDIESGANLIDKAARTVERINNIRMKTGLVTFEAIDRLTQEMGRLLLLHAAEWEGKPFDANAFVHALKAAWGGISIETNPKQVAIPAHSQQIS